MEKNTTFSPNIDKISENIIYLLSIDSRQSISDLAKILRCSRKKIEHRYKRLFEKGFITPLLIFNNVRILKVTILLKISKFNAQIVASLKKIKGIVKAKEALGQYDFSLLFFLENKEELNRVLHEMNALYHNSLQALDVVFHDFEDTLGYKSFCHDPLLFSRYHMLKSEDKQLKVDEMMLIQLLIQNPLTSIKQLIQQTGFTYIHIREMMKALKDNGIIRFSIDPNYELLGLEFHNLLVKINLGNQSLFERYLIKNPRIHWVKKGQGSWDYILSIPAQNIPEFIDTTRKIREENQEIILQCFPLISKIHVKRKL